MKRYLPHVLFAGLALTGPARAITPAGLRDLIAAGGRVALVDLRSQAAYEAGTIPDAMRMTAREAERKPFVGRVVLFDDGTGPDRAGPAATRLAERNTQVQAEALVGGFAAWCDAGEPTTARPGLRLAHERYVTYQDLTGPLAAQADDVVLLDLRPAPARPSDPAPLQALAAPVADAGGVDAAPLPVNLAAELPGFAVTRTPPGVAAGGGDGGIRPLSASAAGTGRPAPLYVLIDNGDGSAGAMARKLKAAGFSRIAILAGGETSIRRKGQPGLQRRGSGAGLDEERDGSPDYATVVEEEEQP